MFWASPNLNFNMPSIIYWGLIMLLPLVTIQLYFKLATRWQILDKPNKRSSHNYITIRGAGIIFPISFLFGTMYHYVETSTINYYALISCLMVSGVSFLDDLAEVNYLKRLAIQLIAGLIMITALDAFQYTWWMVAGLLVLLIGTLNTFNFMDGINGITGLYSLVVLFSMQILITDSILNWVIGAVLVFLFFNARKRAKCFSGDVGAVSLAFIICYGIGRIIIYTGHFQWILMLAVYGIDSVITIGIRLFRKENIFQAHRLHFYQYLTNSKGLGHLTVATGYALIQVIFNLVLFVNHYSGYQYNAAVIIFFIIISMLYILIRFHFEGRSLFQTR